ncbi:MAG: DUF7305 domain-containing protein [Candidatus Xenobium sp.]|jgi:hypothetical protein|nr:hypothetical protein [Burkholderiales bacterium]
MLQDQSRAGFALIMTLLILAALFFFAFALVRLQVADKTLAQTRQHSLIAEQAAKAGIDEALLRLSEDDSWQAGLKEVRLPHSGASYTVTFDHTQSASPFSTHNGGSSSETAGWNGRMVPAGFVHLVSQGSFQGSRVLEEAMVQTTSSPFASALVGANKIVLSGKVLIDAWDSSKGTYAQTIKQSGADLITNSAEARAVEISNVTLHGNIIVGPGGSQDTTLRVSGNPTYLGFKVASKIRELPVETPPDLGPNRGVVAPTSGTQVLTPGTYSAFSPRRATIQLTPGDYVVTGDIIMGNKASILVPQGPVRLFVLGNVSITSGGSLRNSTLKPSNFILYGGANPTTWEFQSLSGSDLYFGINAPNTILDFRGGNEYYGSFIGKEVIVNGNARFHYDVSTGSSDTASSGSSKLILKARW